MRPLPTIRDCSNKAELLQHIAEVHDEVRAFVREIPPTLLNSPGYPDGWTAARNVRHVAKTENLVASWMALPVWLLRLFGSPKKKNATVKDLRPTNRPGLTDYGHYDAGRAATPAQIEALVSTIDAAERKLCRAVERRSDDQLNSLRGMFGGTNLRLFALFGLRHTTHHLGVARSRIEASKH